MPIEKSACLGAAEEAFRLAATTPLGPLAAHFRLFLIERGEVTLPPPPAPTAPQPGLSSVVAALSPAAPPPRRAPHPPPLHLNIRCMDCRSPPKDDPDYDLLVRQDTPSRALFRSPPREILLCHNSLRNDAEVAETLVHEMTHAVDYEVLGMNLADCEALACSEVRAAMAAECNSMSFAWAKKSCTQSRAVRATSLVLGQEKGGKCVAKVFARCYGSSPDKDPLAASSSRS